MIVSCTEGGPEFDLTISRERLALITILADYPGGISWDETRKKRLRSAAMAYIGQPAAKATKAQRDLMRAEIDLLQTGYFLLPFGNRLHILVVTRTSFETDEVTYVALNPELVKSVKGGGA